MTETYPRAGKTAGRVILAVALFAAATPAFGAGKILIDDFRAGLSPRWEEHSFKGRTVYKAVKAGGRSCLEATSDNAASGLIYKIKYDPRRYPVLSWSWKVDHVLTRGDARTREGDDYPARIYVVFPSFFFWRTTVLNYVWANRLPRGAIQPNAFTENAMMIAVESGPEQAGRWVSEQRNIVEDYRRAFGKEPPGAGAIAIMTDTDNTSESARACYGPIRIKGLAGK